MYQTSIAIQVLPDILESPISKAQAATMWLARLKPLLKEILIH